MLGIIMVAIIGYEAGDTNAPEIDTESFMYLIKLYGLYMQDNLEYVWNHIMN